VNDTADHEGTSRPCMLPWNPGQQAADSRKAACSRRTTDLLQILRAVEMERDAAREQAARVELQAGKRKTDLRGEATLLRTQAQAMRAQLCERQREAASLQLEMDSTLLKEMELSRRPSTAEVHVNALLSIRQLAQKLQEQTAVNNELHAHVRGLTVELERQSGDCLRLGEQVKFCKLEEESFSERLTEVESQLAEQRSMNEATSMAVVEDLLCDQGHMSQQAPHVDSVALSTSTSVKSSIAESEEDLDLSYDLMDLCNKMSVGRAMRLAKAAGAALSPDDVQEESFSTSSTMATHEPAGESRGDEFSQEIADLQDALAVLQKASAMHEETATDAFDTPIHDLHEVLRQLQPSLEQSEPDEGLESFEAPLASLLDTLPLLGASGPSGSDLVHDKEVSDEITPDFEEETPDNATESRERTPLVTPLTFSWNAAFSSHSFIRNKYGRSQLER